MERSFARGWTWQGDIPADACVRVGTVEVDVPDINEPLVIDLDLVGARTSTSPTATAPGSSAATTTTDRRSLRRSGAGFALASFTGR